MTDDASPHEVVIGLISDTHGLLRPGVYEALAGVSVILHAGDVGGDEILDELELIAPVHAVYGNTDPPGNPRLHETLRYRASSSLIRVTHGHELGSPTPAALLARYDEDIIVFGHTHRHLVTCVSGRWAINPGAAGPRRFDLEPSVARLMLAPERCEARIIPLT